MSFKSGFESRERESQFNTAGSSEFQVRGAAVLNDRLAIMISVKMALRPLNGMAAGQSP